MERARERNENQVKRIDKVILTKIEWMMTLTKVDIETRARGRPGRRRKKAQNGEKLDLLA